MTKKFEKSYVVVTDFIDLNLCNDVSEGLQKIIDENPNRTIYFPASLFNSLRKRLFNGFVFFFTIPDPPLPYASHCGNSHEYGHHEALRRDLPSSRLRYYVLP